MCAALSSELIGGARHPKAMGRSNASARPPVEVSGLGSRSPNLVASLFRNLEIHGGLIEQLVGDFAKSGRTVCTFNLAAFE